jgi:hypothetical protein
VRGQRALWRPTQRRHGTRHAAARSLRRAAGTWRLAPGRRRRRSAHLQTCRGRSSRLLLGAGCTSAVALVLAVLRRVAAPWAAGRAAAPSAGGQGAAGTAGVRAMRDRGMLRSRPQMQQQPAGGPGHGSIAHGAGGMHGPEAGGCCSRAPAAAARVQARRPAEAVLLASLRAVAGAVLPTMGGAGRGQAPLVAPLLPRPPAPRWPARQQTLRTPRPGLPSRARQRPEWVLGHRSSGAPRGEPTPCSLSGAQ